MQRRETRRSSVCGSLRAIALSALPALHYSPRTAEFVALSTETEYLTLTAEAIRRSLILEQIERTRRSSAALGFAQINYGRLFIRDRWTLFVIARELNCPIEEILSAPDARPSTSTRWADVVDATEVILSSVRELIYSVRVVVVYRSEGRSWRAIVRALPDRALFSMTEDFACGCELVWRRAAPEVRLVASYDHPRIDRVEGRRSARRRGAKLRSYRPERLVA